MKKIWICLFVILCSGCSWIKREETRAVGKFIEEKATHFYEVEDEDELAILVLKNFDEEELQICYRSKNKIQPYRLYLKIKAVLPIKFEMESGKIQMNMRDEIIESVDCIVIRPLESHHEVKQIVMQWANELENSRDQEKVVQSIHDLIVKRTHYGMEKDTAFQATGVFKDNEAVCEGYSLAFNNLASSMHIPSFMISSNTINHAWNMVYINGEWLFVDCTWDDPINGDGTVYQNYCLMNEEEMMETERYQFDENTETTLDLKEYQKFAEKVLLLFE